MNKTKKPRESDPKRSSPDLFNETLRKTLENIADALWLKKNSPLHSTLFVDSKDTRNGIGQLRPIERPDLDEKCQQIWREWQTIPLIPLQAIILEALGYAPNEIDDQTVAILLLTYFDLDQPKQSAVIKTLAMSRATYYRYLERAVESLGYVMVKNLKPALKLEQPPTKPLIGRKGVSAVGEERLQAGHTLQLVGGSGMGKTSLAASWANRWGGSLFWYTLRPHLTDTLEQLLFSIAIFMHQNGESALWIYLTGLNGPPDATHVLMVLRQFLTGQKGQPALFCFDGVELLLSHRERDQQPYEEIRSFFEAFGRMERNGSPLLYIGQQLVLPPEPNGVITLNPLPEEDANRFLAALNPDLSPEHVDSILKLANGTPLLLRLLSLFPRTDHSQSLEEFVQEERVALVLEWFGRHLLQQISETERAVLSELAIFPSGAPRDGWRQMEAVLSTLEAQGVLDSAGAGKIALHPALQRVIYDHIPKPERDRLHIGAGNLLAERSRFTEALFHYVAGGAIELGLWTWYTHRQNEIEQGQARAALTLLAPLSQKRFTEPEDNRAMALLIAQLTVYSGGTEVGLKQLDQEKWPPQRPSTASAHEYRGVLLAHAGRSDESIVEYRKSLELVEQLKSTKEIDLLTRIARSKMINRKQLENEVVMARFQLDVLEGQLADGKGDYAMARIHYANALAVADQISDPTRLARLHEALGVMEARNAHIEAAVEHFEKSSQYHRQYGNMVCAIGTTNTNISYTYLAKRRYAEALETGKIALQFYRSIENPYGMATNEANLAEASFYTGHLEDAVFYAESALKREEEWVRPYCLYVLGHVARVKADWKRSETLCQEAIASAEEIGDPWAEAPARNALGETLRDAGRPDAAQKSHEEALAIWQRMKIEHEVVHTQGLLNQLESRV